MSLWEYKVISSGKGGFATPALLEKFLNDLGRDEWEVIEFRASPENPLAFSGLARRTTQRDWTLEDAAAAAAKAEAEKLRAEFEAKFKAATSPTPAAEERAPSFLEEKLVGDDSFRKPVDTSHDAEPETEEEEKDDWDKLTAAEEDELPTFFEAIKPHMRRNQRGPGMSVGVDYLAKKWDQSEDDLKGALEECGFVLPEDEDSKAEYVEYDGDLYWVNVNRRGELWINLKEKPRPVFRAVKAQRAVVEEEPKPTRPKREEESKPAFAEASAGRRDTGERRPAVEGSAGTSENGEAPGEAAGQRETESAKAEAAAAATPLPQGTELLDKIRPHMRRNRRGPGGSGSASFLSRALRTTEADLRAGFASAGLTIPATPNEKPVFTEIGNEVWWVNLDSRGGLWINGREKKPGETIGAPTAEKTETSAIEPAPLEVATSATAASAEMASAAAEAEAQAEQIPAPAELGAVGDQSQAGSTTRDSTGVLAGVRLLLKETKTGAAAAKIDRVAEELGKSADEVVAMLEGAGLKVPAKPREKPVFVEYAGEVLWFNRNAKGELWVNAKPSKFADKDEDKEQKDGESAGEGEPYAAAGDEGSGEKKPQRGRSRKKPDEVEKPVE